jgi:hypothetical protein
MLLNEGPSPYNQTFIPLRVIVPVPIRPTWSSKAHKMVYNASKDVDIAEKPYLAVSGIQRCKFTTLRTFPDQDSRDRMSSCRKVAR